MAAPEVELQLGSRKVRTDESLQGAVVVTVDDSCAATALMLELSWSVADEAEAEDGEPLTWVWEDGQWVADELPDHARAVPRPESPARAHPYRDGRERELDEAEESPEEASAAELEWSPGTHRLPFVIPAPCGPVSYQGELLELQWRIRALAHVAGDDVIESRTEDFRLEPGDVEEPLLGPGFEPPLEQVGVGWRRPFAAGLMAATLAGATAGCVLAVPHGAAPFYALAAVAGVAVMIALGVWYWKWRRDTPWGAFCEATAVKLCASPRRVREDLSPCAGKRYVWHGWTGEDGTFVFENVPRSQWGLSWVTDGWWHSQPVGRNLEPNQTLHLGTIPMVQSQRGWP